MTRISRIVAIGCIMSAQSRSAWITPEKAFVTSEMPEKRIALPNKTGARIHPFHDHRHRTPHFVANISCQEQIDLSGFVANELSAFTVLEWRAI